MMESSMESCVPPGFRFHPTDEELVGYYLKKKVASQKIDLDVIKDIDLYRIEPWDIQERCRIGYEEQNEWYFFSHKDKKYPTGTRTNRATMAGFWKATGRDKAVYDKSKLIGMRKTLVFYKGRAPNGHKTEWIMHEYRLESDQDNGPPHPQEEGWVVCRAFKKRATGQTKSMEGIWESTYLYDEPSGVSSVVDPSEIDYSCTRQPQKLLAHNFPIPCKQETEANNLNFTQHYSNQFVQRLPQLESPSASLPPIKKPHSEDDDQTRGYNHRQKVTDWRALDKFVASQLSQGDRYVSDSAVSSFGKHNNTDMALLLLQRGEEEAEKINGFFSSSPEFDIGICIFDK